MIKGSNNDIAIQEHIHKSYVISHWIVRLKWGFKRFNLSIYESQKRVRAYFPQYELQKKEKKKKKSFYKKTIRRKWTISRVTDWRPSKATFRSI